MVGVKEVLWVVGCRGGRDQVGARGQGVME